MPPLTASDNSALAPPSLVYLFFFGLPLEDTGDGTPHLLSIGRAGAPRPCPLGAVANCRCHCMLTCAIPTTRNAAGQQIAASGSFEAVTLITREPGMSCYYKKDMFAGRYERDNPGLPPSHVHNGFGLVLVLVFSLYLYLFYFLGNTGKNAHYVPTYAENRAVYIYTLISPRTSHLFRCRQVNDNGFVVIACGSAGSSVTVEIDPQAVKRWIKENWGVAVGLIVGGIVLFFLLRWTYKKKKPAMKSVSDNSPSTRGFFGCFFFGQPERILPVLLRPLSYTGGSEHPVDVLERLHSVISNVC